MVALNFALTFVIALNLRIVMMLDGDEGRAQELDEACGGRIGQQSANSSPSTAAHVRH
jgi:hypothetical protein